MSRGLGTTRLFLIMLEYLADSLLVVFSARMILMIFQRKTENIGV